MNKKYNKLIFMAAYLAYTAIYIARVNLSMAGPELIASDVVNTAQLGLLGSVFSTVYAVGRLINGSLSDKKPPYLMITTGLLLAGLSNAFFGFFPPFIGILILWTVNAYAQSMLWSSVLCVVSSLYEKQEAKKKTSVMVTSVAMGNILGIVINTALITKLGTRFAFIIPGILTLVLGGIIFLTTRDIKPIEAKEEKKHISMWGLLKDRELKLMSVPAMLHGVMKDNISLWMTVFIVDTYLVDLSTSAYYVLLIPIIGFIGRTVYPFIFKMCKEKENAVALIGFILCITASVILSVGKVGMILSVLCLSIIYAAVSMINTSILSIYPMHYLKTGNVASVSGIMDFATYLGAGVSSVIYGVVIDSFGYTPMFVSWAIISVISIIMIFKINKNRD